jgi:outer membrane protein assembly factor BamB
MVRLVPILMLAGTAAAGPNDWPHWRGPNANGTAPAADPPVTWDAKKNVKWKAEVPGRGSATPIVWGDQVFVVTAVKTDRQGKPDELPKVDPKFERKTDPPTNFYEFWVFAFDRNTGKPTWKHKAAEKVPHEGHHETHSYAAGSPTTDGERLYVSFGSFGLYCYNLDGKPVWQRDLGRLISRLGWGEAVTPVVHGDSLLVNWDQEANSKLICLDTRTGKTKWEAPRDERTTWTTPLVVEHKGTTQVIMNGTGHVRAYDLTTGKEIWTGPPMTVNAIPSAVTADGVAYVLSGYRGAAGVAIPLGSTGEVKPVWTISKGTPYVPSPLLSNGRLYFTQGNGNQLTILNAKTGEVLLSQERLPSVRSVYASPIAAGGRVYITGQDGTTVVFKEGERFELLATNKVDDPIDASPVAVGKQLFLRSHGALHCIQE